MGCITGKFNKQQLILNRDQQISRLECQIQQNENTNNNNNQELQHVITVSLQTKSSICKKIHFISKELNDFNDSDFMNCISKLLKDIDFKQFCSPEAQYLKKYYLFSFGLLNQQCLKIKNLNILQIVLSRIIILNNCNLNQCCCNYFFFQFENAIANLIKMIELFVLNNQEQKLIDQTVLDGEALKNHVFNTKLEKQSCKKKKQLKLMNAEESIYLILSLKSFQIFKILKNKQTDVRIKPLLRKV